MLGGGDVYVWVGGAIEGTAAGPMPYLKGLNDIQWHSMVFNDIQCEGEGVWRWRWVSVSGYVTVSAVDTVKWLMSHRCTHVSKKVLYSEFNCEDKNDYNEPSTYTARMRYLMNMIIMTLRRTQHACAISWTSLRCARGVIFGVPEMILNHKVSTVSTVSTGVRWCP